MFWYFIYFIVLIAFYQLINLIYRRWIVREEPTQSTAILITGGAQGLGRETALIYAQKRCKIAIWDIKYDLLDKVKSEITQAGGTAYCYKCDISDRQEVENTARRTLDDMGKIDILINNAAIATHLHHDEIKENHFRKLHEINYLGHAWVTLAFLPHVRHITVIASVLSFIPALKESDYCASKAAINAYFSSLRIELKARKSPVKVTIVYPYHIFTKMFNDMKFGHVKYLLPSQKPGDVAKAIYNGICEKREEIFVPGYAKVLCLIALSFPSEVRDWGNELLFRDACESLKPLAYN
ncbi:unnamed protein product [Blepharisma stoltei]|uniref:Uncharacterized protein n=1 Tax=Blepharisma stoltei TaxID=1481888 RepID=A0AAU9JKR0_9CILI|nr:unnamed protein product [Blepharisma stoltei]